MNPHNTSEVVAQPKAHPTKIPLSEVNALAKRLGDWVWDGVLYNRDGITNPSLVILPNAAGSRIRKYLLEMNQKLSQAGHKGGRATGPTKARPLSPDRAKEMARARWKAIDRPQADLHTGSCELSNQQATTSLQSDVKAEAQRPPGSPNKRE